MYASEGSGKWGTEGAAGTLADLKDKRLEVRRLLVQFSVLASMDLRRELKSDKASMDVDADGEVASPIAASSGAPEGYAPINLPSGTNEMWLALAAESNLFTPTEVGDYRGAGAHFAPLAIRNMEASIHILFKEKHFPHVNMLRECLAHVKGMSSVWSDCATTATTPIPFPYIQLAKLFTFIFLYTLPFALVEELEWLTMLAVLVLALGYFGLDAIGECDNKGMLPLHFSSFVVITMAIDHCLLHARLPLLHSNGNGTAVRYRFKRFAADGGGRIHRKGEPRLARPARRRKSGGVPGTAVLCPRGDLKGE
jgi:hypothetical protein